MPLFFPDCEQKKNFHYCSWTKTSYLIEKKTSWFWTSHRSFCILFLQYSISRKKKKKMAWLVDIERPKKDLSTSGSSWDLINMKKNKKRKAFCDSQKKTVKEKKPEKKKTKAHDQKKWRKNHRLTMLLKKKWKKKNGWYIMWQKQLLLQIWQYLLLIFGKTQKHEKKTSLFNFLAINKKLEI